MSWVLILVPRRVREMPAHPAVIGGYATKEEAEKAGRKGTEWEDDFIAPEYTNFVVIPGAADTPP